MIDGEITRVGATVVAFSCSSNLTISETARDEFEDAATFAPVQPPAVMPSRQIWKLVLKLPVPP